MGWLDEVGDTVAAEFADFGDVPQITRIVVRLGLATLLGFALGFEREQRGKAAGIRTHMLVAIGSALFVLVPQQSGIVAGDISRLIQGLTSAAGLWMTAAIGMACGLGRETMALLSTLLALAVLTLMPYVVRLIERALGEPLDRTPPRR